MVYIALETDKDSFMLLMLTSRGKAILNLKDGRGAGC